MLQAAPKNVHIYLESNPNPNSLKFVVNEMLVPEAMSFDFPDAESTGISPLAKDLFSFPFVDRVFFASNFITVTKKEDVEWLEIQSTLKENNIPFAEESHADLAHEFPSDFEPSFDKAIKFILE